MYKLQENSILRTTDNASIPLAEGNRDYQQFIIDVANGATVEGETVTEPSYAELRAAAYPSMAEQADMMYHDQVDGTTTWKDAIQAVKDKYPKTITGGESIAEVPAWVAEKADAWLFNDQLTKYKAAVERLSQYVLADGRPEIIESQPTGEEVWNEETQEMEAVMADVVVQTAVEPLEPTVERTVYSEDDPMAEPTVEIIENPEIIRDNAERAAAQAVVDNTPPDVIETT